MGQWVLSQVHIGQTVKFPILSGKRVRLFLDKLNDVKPVKLPIYR